MMSRAAGNNDRGAPTEFRGAPLRVGGAPSDDARESSRDVDAPTRQHATTPQSAAETLHVECDTPRTVGARQTLRIASALPDAETPRVARGCRELGASRRRTAVPTPRTPSRTSRLQAASPTRRPVTPRNHARLVDDRTVVRSDRIRTVARTICTTAQRTLNEACAIRNVDETTRSAAGPSRTLADQSRAMSQNQAVTSQSQVETPHSRTVRSASRSETSQSEFATLRDPDLTPGPINHRPKQSYFLLRTVA